MRRLPLFALLLVLGFNARAQEQASPPVEPDRGGHAVAEKRSVMCYQRSDGKLLWQRDIIYKENEITHPTNPFCSASPVTDGERVIAHHGSAGLVCYDFDGKELWKYDTGKLEHLWGTASSPILYGDLCIIWCGPGERQFTYGVHYGPQGANYDSEGVQAPQMVGIIGAYRRDMNLAGGDQTIGIASGTYRLRNRVSVKVLDNFGATADGAQPKQSENANNNGGQLWNIALISGTTYFTLQNVASGKYLDSMGATADGAAVVGHDVVGVVGWHEAGCGAEGGVVHHDGIFEMRDCARRQAR